MIFFRNISVNTLHKGDNKQTNKQTTTTTTTTTKTTTMMIIIKSTRRKGRIFEVGRMSLQWLALASLIRTKKKIEKGTLLSNILVFIIIIIIINFCWYLLMCRLNSTSANYNASKKHKNSTKQYKDIKQKH